MDQALNPPKMMGLKRKERRKKRRKTETLRRKLFFWIVRKEKT